MPDYLVTGPDGRKMKVTAPDGADTSAVMQFLKDAWSNAGDLAQSASNAVASNVAGPVDLITTGLNKLGAGIQHPMGGEEWMKSKGLMRDVPQGLPRIAGETLGNLAPAAAANGAPKTAQELMKGTLK